MTAFNYHAFRIMDVGFGVGDGLTARLITRCHHYLHHPCSDKIQNGDILVPANLCPPGKTAVKLETEYKVAL